MNKFIPIKKSKASEFCIAGWNDVIEEKHEAARQAFLEWCYSGKPRNGYSFQLMKLTRARFKLALRYCKSHEDVFESNALAKEYLSNNTNNFWKQVKKETNGKMTKSANSINGVTGDAAIANLWKESFAKLYSMHDNSDLLNVMSECNDDDEARVITCTDVIKSVDKMKCRKACGPDGISTEAIKFGGHLLTVHLTLLFNLFLSHCYMPSDLLKTTVVPILKNKMGDISDVNNYRAIALSNSISKLLETIILNCFQSHDKSEDIYQLIWIQEKSFHLFRLLYFENNY